MSLYLQHSLYVLQSQTCITVCTSISGKVLPKTDHEGLKRDLMCGPILSLTSTLDGGEWSTPYPGCFTPGKDPVSTVQEVDWALGLVQKISPPPGFYHQTKQPIESHYTDYTILVHPSQVHLLTP